jgi:hypothetical protein
MPVYFSADMVSVQVETFRSDFVIFALGMPSGHREVAAVLRRDKSLGICAWLPQSVIVSEQGWFP